ncbi:hypothetical protein SUNI508_11773 [Seiridium unicorne]|uniref:Uncharacterized protein n=1 Tax=Seiridium unicorne TaxID=138068 RepID=A0ABR2UGE2_9PEZI
MLHEKLSALTRVDLEYEPEAPESRSAKPSFFELQRPTPQSPSGAPSFSLHPFTPPLNQIHRQNDASKPSPPVLASAKRLEGTPGSNQHAVELVQPEPAALAAAHWVPVVRDARGRDTAGPVDTVDVRAGAAEHVDGGAAAAVGGAQVQQQRAGHEEPQGHQPADAARHGQARAPRAPGPGLGRRPDEADPAGLEPRRVHVRQHAPGRHGGEGGRGEEDGWSTTVSSLTLIRC